jgi:hypothetical protein
MQNRGTNSSSATFGGPYLKVSDKLPTPHFMEMRREKAVYWRCATLMWGWLPVEIAFPFLLHYEFSIQH